jgi:hypothetical protein
MEILSPRLLCRAGIGQPVVLNLSGIYPHDQDFRFLRRRIEGKVIAKVMCGAEFSVPLGVSANLEDCRVQTLSIHFPPC